MQTCPRNGLAKSSEVCRGTTVPAMRVAPPDVVKRGIRAARITAMSWALEAHRWKLAAPIRHWCTNNPQRGYWLNPETTSCGSLIAQRGYRRHNHGMPAFGGRADIEDVSPGLCCGSEPDIVARSRFAGTKGSTRQSQLIVGGRGLFFPVDCSGCRSAFGGSQPRKYLCPLAPGVKILAHKSRTMTAERFQRAVTGNVLHCPLPPAKRLLLLTVTGIFVSLPYARRESLRISRRDCTTECTAF